MHRTAAPATKNSLPPNARVSRWTNPVMEKLTEKVGVGGRAVGMSSAG